jgi:hypothetical protein
VNSSQGGGSKDTWVVGRDPLHVDRHSIQGLVADQASITQSIPIITGDHTQDHSPLDGPRSDQDQQQQQQGPPGAAAASSTAPNAPTNTDIRKGDDATC